MPLTIYTRSGPPNGPGTDKGISMARRGLIAIFIVAVLLVASMAAAFALLGGSPDDGPGGDGISIIDDRGKNVTLAKAPERIVSLGSSFTEIIFDLGRIDAVVAADYSSMWLAPYAASGIINLNQVSSLNVESILAHDPDLVIIWNYNMYQSFIGNMEKANITVLAFNPTNVDTVLSTISRLGTAIGEEANATALVSGMQERIDTITAMTSTLSDSQKPRVYLELKTMGGRAAGNGTISDELMVMAGGINICNDVSGTWDVQESIINDRDPDIIVIENGGRATADLVSFLSPSVTAVSKNQIYRIADGTITTSPSMVDALENLAKWFHPELFD